MEENKLDELFNELKSHWTAFETEHVAFTAKGNKAAGARARKAIMEIKKLVTDYKKVSVDSTKK